MMCGSCPVHLGSTTVLLQYQDVARQFDLPKTAQFSKSCSSCSDRKISLFWLDELEATAIVMQIQTLAKGHATNSHLTIRSLRVGLCISVTKSEQSFQRHRGCSWWHKVKSHRASHQIEPPCRSCANAPSEHSPPTTGGCIAALVHCGHGSGMWKSHCEAWTSACCRCLVLIEDHPSLGCTSVEWRELVSPCNRVHVECCGRSPHR